LAVSSSGGDDRTHGAAGDRPHRRGGSGEKASLRVREEICPRKAEVSQKAKKLGIGRGRGRGRPAVFATLGRIFLLHTLAWFFAGSVSGRHLGLRGSSGDSCSSRASCSCFAAIAGLIGLR
jgi:hypothetical protein